MPTYSPPNFNALLDVYQPPATPAANPPTYTNVLCQVYINGRVPYQMFHLGSGRWLPGIIIRLPFAYSATLRIDSTWRDKVVCPTSPVNYKVQHMAKLHTGFPNQYHSLYCLQCNDDGTIPQTPLPT